MFRASVWRFRELAKLDAKLLLSNSCEDETVVWTELCIEGKESKRLGNESRMDGDC